MTFDCANQVRADVDQRGALGSPLDSPSHVGLIHSYYLSRSHMQEYLSEYDFRLREPSARGLGLTHNYMIYKITLGNPLK